MKGHVSEDELRIEIRLVFVEGGGCLDCALSLKSCEFAPCGDDERKDGKNGHFELE